MSRRYFQDLSPGEVRESAPLVVERAAMLEFARQYDPQYFHADESAARRSVFGEVIASGIYTAALWRQLDHQISADIAWICGVAWQETRWPVALRAGDTIRARAGCISKRQSATDPARGIVTMRYELLNQRGQVVFETTSVNLIEMRPDPPGGPEP